MSEAKKWTSQAGPIQTKRIDKLIRDIVWNGKSRTEVTGPREYPDQQSRCTLTPMFTGVCRPEVLADYITVADKYNWTITSENYKQLLAELEQVNARTLASIPIDDKTTTQAERDELAAERKADEEKRANDDREHNRRWVELFGKPDGARVEVPKDAIAVTLKLCYNNSDSMTDYFDAHATLSPAFVVLVRHTSRETEAFARNALDLLPDDIKALKWEWHTEKYSMGHGNYLESAGFELSPAMMEAHDAKYYGHGGKVTHGHYELQFTSSRYAGGLYAHRCYGTAPAVSPSPAASEPVTAATVRINKDKGGVEVVFPAKPAQTVIDSLKSAGFRWSRFAGCWWNRGTTDAARAACAAIGIDPAPILAELNARADQAGIQGMESACGIA